MNSDSEFVFSGIICFGSGEKVFLIDRYSDIILYNKNKSKRVYKVAIFSTFSCQDVELFLSEWNRGSNLISLV